MTAGGPGLTRLLASLGTLPFIACALLQLAGIEELPVLGTTARIAVAYALTIASFMAGVHWGTALNVEARLPTNLYVTSNVVAIAAWLSFLLSSLALTLLLLAFLFACLLFVDLRLLRAGIIDRHYWHTRVSITVVVIAALLIIASTA